MSADYSKFSGLHLEFKAAGSSDRFEGIRKVNQSGVIMQTEMKKDYYKPQIHELSATSTSGAAKRGDKAESHPNMARSPS